MACPRSNSRRATRRSGWRGRSPPRRGLWRRASPDSPPFVEVGSVVKAGDKLLLVEAMKTFNEIVAPVAGTVVSILVEDGQPVEYGQPLFVIE